MYIDKLVFSSDSIFIRWAIADNWMVTTPPSPSTNYCIIHLRGKHFQGCDFAEKILLTGLKFFSLTIEKFGLDLWLVYCVKGMHRICCFLIYFYTNGLNSSKPIEWLILSWCALWLAYLLFIWIFYLLQIAYSMIHDVTYVSSLW